MKKILLTACLVITGCAAPNTGIVPIGSGQYMLSKMGGLTDWTGGTVKAELYKEGIAFCQKEGKELVPLNSRSEDAGYSKYASAEIQFRCN